jgi:hypothetical protein
VGPAIEEMRTGRRTVSFGMLEQAIDQFTEEPSGVGFDLPDWLEALEDEVERVRAQTEEGPDPDEASPQVPQVRLTLDEAQRQLEAWAEK